MSRPRSTPVAPVADVLSLFGEHADTHRMSSRANSVYLEGYDPTVDPVWPIPPNPGAPPLTAMLQEAEAAALGLG